MIAHSRSVSSDSALQSSTALPADLLAAIFALLETEERWGSSTLNADAGRMKSRAAGTRRSQADEPRYCQPKLTLQTLVHYRRAQLHLMSQGCNSSGVQRLGRGAREQQQRHLGSRRPLKGDTAQRCDAPQRCAGCVVGAQSCGDATASDY